MDAPYLLLFAGVLAASTAAAQGGSTLPAGMFSTLGNQIVGQNQNPVRLSCVYWQGMNAEDGTLSNLSSPFNGYQANMEAISAAGFNCVRVDINNISLHDSGTAAFLQELDSVVSAAGSAGVRIIIVDHDNEGNYGSNDNYSNDCAAQQANGIWYDLGGASNGTDGCNDTGHTTQASFQSDWVFGSIALFVGEAVGGRRRSEEKSQGAGLFQSAKGGESPLLPCHTTGHAGPHPAVRLD